MISDELLDELDETINVLSSLLTMVDKERFEVATKYARQAQERLWKERKATNSGWLFSLHEISLRCPELKIPELYEVFYWLPQSSMPALYFVFEDDLWKVTSIEYIPQIIGDLGTWVRIDGARTIGDGIDAVKDYMKIKVDTTHFKIFRDPHKKETVND